MPLALTLRTTPVPPSNLSGNSVLNLSSLRPAMKSPSGGSLGRHAAHSGLATYRRERATCTVLMGTGVMPLQPDKHDICHARGVRDEQKKCVRRGLCILYMPMASSAPATNSSKPISVEHGGEAADPWLTIS